ncbi:GNAT family protein [Kribbella sp. NPDC051718]|uniref:GNAT family N-acetyltransferase n=1 Tax=Kribbella sp. NPDC051718 TaxID=3155168 RepID=UPI00342F2BD9
MKWPVLTGQRVTLRVLTMDDVDAWLSGDDEEQQRWFEAPGPAPRENVVRLVEESRNAWATSGPKRHWAIWMGDVLAGGIDIADRGQGSAYLSYVVFPAARRQGVAAEAILLVTTWAFATWPITRAVAVIDELNTASRSTAERAGFHFEAVADPSEYGESGKMLRYVLPRP